jgi:hypothetical protein
MAGVNDALPDESVGVCDLQDSWRQASRDASHASVKDKRRYGPAQFSEHILSHISRLARISSTRRKKQGIARSVIQTASRRGAGMDYDAGGQKTLFASRRS